MRLIVSFVCFFVLSISNIWSQKYDAPTLLCAQNANNNNIITWKIPVVTCGTFNSYNLFASNSFNGPYTQIATITSVSQTAYTEVGISAATPRFYFMQSDFNCIGQTSKSSDTFQSTSDYSRPKIKSVSVENGKTIIRWNPNPELQTYAYNILIPNIKIIDSVKGRFNDSFIDSDQNPNIKSVTYSIVARDFCGGGDQGISEESFAHSTIFLKKTENPCKGNIDLTWDPYIGWDGPGNDTVFKYNIWISKNGAPEKLIVSNEPNNRSFVYTDYIVGDSLCIRVQGINAADNTIYAYSNQHCFIVNKVQKPRYFFITKIDVLSANKVQLEWLTDSLSNVKEVIIKRGPAANQLTEIFKYSVNGKMPFISTYLDTTANTNDLPIYYGIFDRDSCGEDAETSVKSDLYLSAEQSLFFENKLTWKPLDLDHSKVFRYRLYRDKGDGILQEIGVFQPDVNSYLDNIEALYTQRGVICYKVVAEYQIDTANIFQKNYIENSNYACIKQRPLVHVPNAFRPDGLNKIFKPMIIFGNTTNYTLQIFNRWGAMIFESKDVNTGWDGTIGGAPGPQEEYSYLITLYAQDDTPIVKKGTVLLLR